jgi:hypothetical protein
MPSEHIVVDGSNIATEGRNLPSLAQLEEAVSELRREFPEAEVTVIVDATFSHRIDASELERFEKAALEGEYVHPPAGAIGRGDAFLLRIAEKVDAIVLSNDSFQEFHGEHPWLFERGRLLGATPVPGVGWIFTPRTPVRGPKSRKAVQDTGKARRQVSKAIEVATKEVVSPPTGSSGAGGRPRRRGRAAAAGEQASDGGVPAKKAGGRKHVGGGSVAGAVNDPLTFISFIAEHPLGKEVTGRVDGYTSHGAVVFIGTVQCYIPLSNLGDPPPRSARAVLKRNEERTFVVTALDPLRRGVELALPGQAEVSGRPSEEMIAAEVRLAKKKAVPAPVPAPARTKKSSPPKRAARTAKEQAAPEPAKPPPPAEKLPRTKKAGPDKQAAAPPAKTVAGSKKAAAPQAELVAGPKKAAARRKPAGQAVKKDAGRSKKVAGTPKAGATR